jgi:hypothetical protein
MFVPKNVLLDRDLVWELVAVTLLPQTAISKHAVDVQQKIVDELKANFMKGPSYNYLAMSLSSAARRVEEKKENLERAKHAASLEEFGKKMQDALKAFVQL